MEDHKKLEFVHKMAALGLKHFDAGGLAVGAGVGAETGATVGSVVPGIGTAIGAVGGGIIGGLVGMGESATPAYGSPGTQNPYVQSNATNPNTGVAGTIAGSLGLTNNFQASSANVQPGTNAAQLNNSYNGVQSALGQYSPLMSQYNNLAAGLGANPAQAQLAQATQANTANQAALMAGQRGSSSNVGLMARQNAMQGAATQQASAGQAATMGAQQQVAALQNQAGLVQGQAGQQIEEQNALQNANSAFNNSIVGMQSNINTTNAQTSANNAGIVGGVMGGMGSGLSSIGSLFAEGGSVKRMAQGGPTTAGNPLVGDQTGGGPMSILGKSIAAGSSGTAGSGSDPSQSGSSSPYAGDYQTGQALGQGIGAIANAFKSNPASGSTNAVDGGSSWAGGDMGSGSSAGGMLGDVGSMFAANGGDVRQVANKGAVIKAKNKSEKSVSKGNSYANDKIPAMLSEGEVVIDHDTLNDPGQIGQMARAIKQHIEQRNTAKGVKN